MPACFGTGAPFTQATVRSWQELSEGCAHSGSTRRDVYVLPLFCIHCPSSRCSQNVDAFAPFKTLLAPLCLQTDSGSLVPPSLLQRKWPQGHTVYRRLAAGREGHSVNSRVIGARQPPVGETLKPSLGPKPCHSVDMAAPEPVKETD